MIRCHDLTRENMNIQSSSSSSGIRAMTGSRRAGNDEEGSGVGQQQLCCCGRGELRKRRKCRAAVAALLWD